jgi:hypothetical protein
MTETLNRTALEEQSSSSGRTDRYMSSSVEQDIVLNVLPWIQWHCVIRQSVLVQFEYNRLVRALCNSNIARAENGCKLCCSEQVEVPLYAFLLLMAVLGLDSTRGIKRTETVSTTAEVAAKKFHHLHTGADVKVKSSYGVRALLELCSRQRHGAELNSLSRRVYLLQRLLVYGLLISSYNTIRYNLLTPGG